MKKVEVLRQITLVLMIAFLVLTNVVTDNFSTLALGKNTVKVNRKKIEMYVGKTKRIKLKNVNQRVKWKVANKKVAKIVKKSGAKKNSIKIKALKKGTTKITAKWGKKKYVVKVTVKKKKDKKNISSRTTVTPTQQETTKQVSIEQSTTKAEEITTGTEEIKTVITGKAINDKIKVGEDLEIEFFVSGNTEGKYISYGLEPVSLKKLVDGSWIEITYAKDFQGFIEREYNIVGTGPAYLKVPLYEIYADNSPGDYCYTHRVGGVDISIKFSIENQRKRSCMYIW